MSRAPLTGLRGEILQATEDELEELIRIVDKYPSMLDWFSDWASGKHATIADVHDRMRTVPATPRAVIAYFRVLFSKEK